MLVEWLRMIRENSNRLYSVVVVMLSPAKHLAQPDARSSWAQILRFAQNDKARVSTLMKPYAVEVLSPFDGVYPE